MSNSFSNFCALYQSLCICILQTFSTTSWPEKYEIGGTKPRGWSSPLMEMVLHRFYDLCHWETEVGSVQAVCLQSQQQIPGFLPSHAGHHFLHGCGMVLWLRQWDGPQEAWDVLCRGWICCFLLGNIHPDLWEHLPESWSQCRLQDWIPVSLSGAVSLSNKVLIGKSLFLPGGPGRLMPDSITGVAELMPPGQSWALAREQVLIRSRFMGAQFCSWKLGNSWAPFQCTLAQPGRRAGMDAPEHTEGRWAHNEPAHQGRSLEVTPTSTNSLLCLAADSDAASCLQHRACPRQDEQRKDAEWCIVPLYSTLHVHTTAVILRFIQLPDNPSETAFSWMWALLSSVFWLGC